MAVAYCIVELPPPPPPCVFCRGRGLLSSVSGGSPPLVAPAGGGLDLDPVGPITGSDAMNHNSSSHCAR
jgi:hypothetical protein